jgi:hypothetical protein
MDRNLVYPGSIPLDTDVLNLNRSTMVAIGYLAQATLGTTTVVDGLSCTPTVPASMTISVGPGSIAQLGVVDPLAFGSLPADSTDPLVKMGVNVTATPFTISAPTTSGQSVNYLIEASFQESDTNPIVLPYYNAANPAQPYSGPANSGTPQNTQRVQRVQLQLKAGAPANTGSQATPAVDNGWVGLYAITVAYGQTTVTASNISVFSAAPFIRSKLATLSTGFGAGVQTFAVSSSFTVPPGVTQVEAEIWGGGCGSYASTSSSASGGGAGGGYARKRISGLTPGQVVPVTVGSGGAGGTTSGGAPAAGNSSSFGAYVSATGGTLNPLASISNPQNGASPGVGISGDINLTGSAGQSALMGAGGLGGGAPMGGSQGSGTIGNNGIFPGGGASGAGTGTTGTTPFNGGAGANGFVVVRW